MHEEYKRLLSGSFIPLLCLNTNLLTNNYSVQSTLNFALSLNYRHFVIHIQDENIFQISNYFFKKIKELKLKRSELFFTLVIKPINCIDFDKEIKTNIKNLKLDYLDFLILDNSKNLDTNNKILRIWLEMEMLCDLKLVKSLGLYNCNSKLYAFLVNYANVIPAVLYIKYSIFDRYNDLIKLGNEYGSVIIAYGIGSNENLNLIQNLDYKHKLTEKYNFTFLQIVLSYLYIKGILISVQDTTRDKLLEYKKFIKLDPSDIEIIEEYIKNYSTINL
ncbi:hypothetical protein GVAV_000497 [Gurleya vavrai]